jgi:lipopolysaccharide biosynthesis glycosyltransferase
MKRSIWIGFDPREAAAFAVARASVRNRLTQPIPIRGVVLGDLQKRSYYWRPTRHSGATPSRGLLWDEISNAPMSTEFAISRFLVPFLAREGWALFMDGDVLVRANLVRLFDALDPAKAVYCVQHKHEPPPGLKMDGQIQTQYARKNWSSVMVWNVSHPANQALSLSMVNSLPGRDLHRFCWLADELIGALDPAWNFLVGHTAIKDVPDPAIVHFTAGTPDMAGYEQCLFADEWRSVLAAWAS